MHKDSTRPARARATFRRTPLPLETLVTARQSPEENLQLRSEFWERGAFGHLRFTSERMRAVAQQIEIVAPSEISVLIVGESGTGKDLVARTLHDMSRRRKGPFVAVECAAVALAEFDSLFFGQALSPRSGHPKRAAGVFERAMGGTLFLDGVGELPERAQARLFGILQEREYKRGWTNHAFPLDIRIVASTIRDPVVSIANGELRQDLFYRLNGFAIRIPPLRERTDDIALLARYFAEEFATANSLPVASIEDVALERLKAYPWPGNARELKNAIERSALLAGFKCIRVEHLPAEVASPRGGGRLANADASRPTATPDLKGQFRILAELGAGGGGLVYKALDTRLRRLVAVKFLGEDADGRARSSEELIHEARAASALNHPNICTIHSIEEHEGRQFIVMEYIEGQSLRDRLRTGPFPVDHVLNIARQIAGALAAAHTAGIVHRDITPANVLVDTNGRVKVLDFGLAKCVGRSDGIAALMAESTWSVSDDLTSSGKIVGTYPYMSPEQLSARPLDASTDVFSFGAVVYEIASGRRPFDGETIGALISSILTDTPPTLAQLRSDLPQGLSRIVERCLQKDPTQRFRSGVDLCEAVMRISDS